MWVSLIATSTGDSGGKDDCIPFVQAVSVVCDWCCSTYFLYFLLLAEAEPEVVPVSVCMCIHIISVSVVCISAHVVYCAWFFQRAAVHFGFVSSWWSGRPSPTGSAHGSQNWGWVGGINHALATCYQLGINCDVLLMHVRLPAYVLPVVFQLDVHQQHILRCYMRRNNMDHPPPQSSPHKHKRIRKRSTSVVNEDKMDRLETSLLAAGVKPEWLKVHRIISKRCAPCCSMYILNVSACAQFHWINKHGTQRHTCALPCIGNDQ